MLGLDWGSWELAEWGVLVNAVLEFGVKIGRFRIQLSAFQLSEKCSAEWSKCRPKDGLR